MQITGNWSFTVSNYSFFFQMTGKVQSIKNINVIQSVTCKSAVNRCLGNKWKIIDESQLKGTCDFIGKSGDTVNDACLCNAL